MRKSNYIQDDIVGFFIKIIEKKNKNKIVDLYCSRERREKNAGFLQRVDKDCLFCWSVLHPKLKNEDKYLLVCDPTDKKRKKARDWISLPKF